MAKKQKSAEKKKAATTDQLPCNCRDEGGDCWNSDCDNNGQKCPGDCESRCVGDKPSATAIEKSYDPAVKVDLITSSRYQTRKTLGDIGSLAADIAVHGILNPVTIRKVAFDFELIAGHRRLQAAKEAGLATVPAIVVTCDESTAAEMCVVENMQRLDLTPIEEAEGVKALLDTGHTRKDAADRLGRSEKWVARRANLLNLIPEIKEKVGDDEDVIGLIPLAGLELIASMPSEVQESLVKYFWDYGGITIGQIEGQICRMMRDLAKAPFRTADCQNCQKRTGAQPDLFDANMSGRARSETAWTRGATRRSVTRP